MRPMPIKCLRNMRTRTGISRLGSRQSIQNASGYPLPNNNEPCQPFRNIYFHVRSKNTQKTRYFPKIRNKMR